MSLEQKLKKLFIEEKLSISDCADKLDLSTADIRYYLKKFKIKRNGNNLISNTEIRVCTKCNASKDASEFYYQSYARTDRKSRQGSWCKVCMRGQTVARQRKYKQMAIDYKGGKCEICGYSRYIGALEFHHLDPTQKDFQMSTFSKKPIDELGRKELDKCKLLCANCHREEHSRLNGNI